MIAFAFFFIEVDGEVPFTRVKWVHHNTSFLSSAACVFVFCTYPYGHLVDYHAVDDVENDDYKKSQEVSSGSLSLCLTAIRVDFEENEQGDEW